ncbi:MAG: hypothetical protein V7693_15210 [Halopseudomonas sabulinigri]|tara:strand:+ start:40271 stop:40762 length:492 start_codon:yes stop_codon:yes gene_type:complete
MTQRDPSEPSRLLEDLESIRTLLDEQNDDQPASPDDPSGIPLLQDIIVEPLSAAAPSSHASPPYSLPPRPADKPHNPFLPYASLAKLAEERMQLDQLLAGQMPPPPTLSPTAGAREVRLEARLQAEAQLILQGVIDDLIPTIENELRKRMQNKLQQIVREQLK